MNYYFEEFKDSENPILDSWERDCDEVWDAQAYLENYFETHKNEKH